MKSKEEKPMNLGEVIEDSLMQDLGTFETYHVLKKSDPKDEIEMTDILNFCARVGDRPCDKHTHQYCTFIPMLPNVYCKKNPIERDFRKFVAEEKPVSKSEYLLMRLAQAQGNLN